MPPAPDDADALPRYAREVLAQAQALAAAHERPGAPAYSELVGPHLRHVIEHFEAWLDALGQERIDYDRRPREAALEHDPGLARARLQRITLRLTQCPPSALAAPLRVRASIGQAGSASCMVDSSVGRELLFVTSHAVHHFALLQAHCRQHGIRIDANFGKAPATVAHERARAHTPPQPIDEDSPCPMLTPTA